MLGPARTSPLPLVPVRSRSQVEKVTTSPSKDQDLPASNLGFATAQEVVVVGWNSGLDKRLLGGTCPGGPETAQREGNMAGYSLQGQCVQCSAPENCALMRSQQCLCWRNRAQSLSVSWWQCLLPQWLGLLFKARALGWACLVPYTFCTSRSRQPCLSEPPLPQKGHGSLGLRVQGTAASL